MHGNGVFESKAKFIYKGEFQSNKFDGHGEFQSLTSEVSYVGNFKNNRKHGKGKLKTS